MSKWSSDTVLFFGWENEKCLKIIKYILAEINVQWMNPVFNSFACDEIENKINNINILLKQYNIRCESFRGIDIHECKEQTKIILFIGELYEGSADLGKVDTSIISYDEIKKNMEKYNKLCKKYKKLEKIKPGIISFNTLSFVP